ncbi:MAG: H(+)/Cl(-) exchange transporter ClcA [Planctomycetes bacterium]|nr:H(+)/Cl(-) exchange transporter ClcA [Planctomycetota bacterium]
MKLQVIKQGRSWMLNQRFIDADTKNFRLIFFAFVVGIIVGVIGSIFRLTLTYIEAFRNSLYAGAGNSGPISWVWPFLFAVIGVSIALFLTKKFAAEASGSGVQEIEGALDEIRPMRWKRVLPVKFIASLFSLGSGLLLGREGPTIQIGANIGKMIKDIFRRPNEETNPLVSAGAAAGLASAFNAPFAGIMFVIEEMHGHFRYNFFSVAAIMVASCTADAVVRAIVGADPVIKMTVFPSPALSGIWLFIILGLLFSLVGYFFNKLLILSLNLFSDLSKIAIVLSGIVTGLIIAIIGIFFPELIGGGYKTIRIMLDHSLSLQVLIIFFIGRMLLTVFSYGTGVPGGIFAPMLAIGVSLGMLFGSVMQHYFPGLIPHPGIFAVAGMAGIFASTVRAPLTGIVLAVEMTSNYELALPLIITTVTASVVTALLGNEPIYTTLLKRTLAKTKSA